MLDFNEDNFTVFCYLNFLIEFMLIHRIMIMFSSLDFTDSTDSYYLYSLIKILFCLLNLNFITNNNTENKTTNTR